MKMKQALENETMKIEEGDIVFLHNPKQIYQVVELHEVYQGHNVWKVRRLEDEGFLCIFEFSLNKIDRGTALGRLTGIL